jgi:hypothetical protein
MGKPVIQVDAEACRWIKSPGKLHGSRMLALVPQLIK